MADDRRRREHMVAEQLAARDITDPRVLEAMRHVPRHEFVPEQLAASAYDDRPLPIGWNVTISQPYIVAYMTQALGLRPGDRVLEIGAGSGYAAAVLAEIADDVTTIESIEPLADIARDRLAVYGDRVHVVTGDGSLGHPDRAPYDAIVITAAAPEVPPPVLEQLGPGGRLVAPIGRRVEHLVRITRTPHGDRRERLLAVRFVPLTGAHGTGTARA